MTAKKKDHMEIGNVGMGVVFDLVGQWSTFHPTKATFLFMIEPQADAFIGVAVS